jgi:hexosaminidase
MPTDRSRHYQSAFEIPLAENEKTVLNLVVVTPAGRRSIVYGATFLRRPYVAAVAHNDSQPGISYTVYDGNFTTTNDLEQGVQTTTGTTDSFDLQQFGRQKQYGLQFKGYLQAPVDGFYELAVESDDGAVLEIDNDVVVDNDGNHGIRLVSGYIPLRQGFHRIQLRYFQAEGGAWLRVLWAPAGAELKPIDRTALYH